MSCPLGVMATEIINTSLAGSTRSAGFPPLEAGHCDSAGRTLTTEISFYIRREQAEGKQSLLRSERKKWVPCFRNPCDVAKRFLLSVRKQFSRVGI